MLCAELDGKFGPGWAVGTLTQKDACRPSNEERSHEDEIGYRRFPTPAADDPEPPVPGHLLGRLRRAEATTRPSLTWHFGTLSYMRSKLFAI